MTYELADGYKIRDQSGLYFLTFTVEGWVDLFTRQTYRDIFLANMAYCREHKELSVGAYAIMTNHVHLIWRSKSGRLSDTIRDFKSYSTKKFIEAIKQGGESRGEWLLYMFEFFAAKTARNKEYKIWTNNNHPEEITSMEFLRTKLDYIHNNPVRAGWVDRAEDYVYSSAANYCNRTGKFEVDFLF